MNDGKITVRYARALFSSALEKKLLDAVSNDMKFILELCRIDDIKEVLESPVIVPSRKCTILRSVTRGHVDELTLSFLDLVVKKGRENFIPAIAREFIREAKLHKGITESVLTTAVRVDDTIRSQISSLVAGIFKTKAELKEEIDKDIIGGFILKVDDNYIDASVRKKLRTIEKELKEKALSA